MPRQLISRPWRDADVLALRSMLQAGVPVSAIARRLHRTESAVRHAIFRFALHSVEALARLQAAGQTTAAGDRPAEDREREHGTA